jgi:hypothetical protein
VLMSVTSGSVSMCTYRCHTNKNAITARATLVQTDTVRPKMSPVRSTSSRYIIKGVRFECQTKTLTYFECQTQGSSVRLTGSSVRLTLNMSLTFEPCQADIPFRFECETKKRG